MNTKPVTWQQILAEAFDNAEDLCRHLRIEPEHLLLSSESRAFPLKVPRGFAELMEPGNPDDPLLRQVLPLQDEMRRYPGYSSDPVGDLQAVAAEGVIHKYHGRVLLIATGACAIHCRYCFRRNFPYGELQLSSQKLQQALDYIGNREEISEAILSGGDPLLLNDEKLGRLLAKLGAIPHLKRLRIHSRIPVVLPQRITPALLENLAATGKQMVMVIHANHGNELSGEVGAACARLAGQGVTLLNQSVLLRGVNDDSGILRRLSERLFAFGVLPYYLHLLDRVSGAGHFEVSENSALELMAQIRRELPGYLVPRLVKEQAGAAYKIAIC